MATFRPRQKRLPHMTEEGNNTMKGKVLVMDDQEMLREVAVAMLEELGYDAITAEDGEQAVDKYRQSLNQGAPIDLVIMDLTVPGGMGGADSARNILKLDGNAKIMVCSGHAADEVISRYRDYGFCGVIGKPYNFDELARAIDAVLTEPV